MADQLSPWMLGGDCHLYPTRRQRDYLKRCSACLGYEETWRVQGAESGEDGPYDHKGWQVFHYDATARGGRSAEIDGERTAGHGINADREGFASRSSCPFIAPFSSVFHTPPTLTVASKVTTLAMYSMFFFVDCLLYLQAVFRVAKKMPLWT